MTPKTTERASASKSASKTPARKTPAVRGRKTSSDDTRAVAAADQIRESAAVAAAAQPEAQEVVELALPDADHPSLGKKELVDLAVARSGVKKRDAKPAIEAALAILGEALSEGRELNLKPFGKLKVTRMKKGGNGQIINARVRQPDLSENTPTSGLAPAAE